MSKLFLICCVPQPGMNVKKIIEANFIAGGQAANLEMVNATAVAWFRLYPNANPQDLQCYINRIGARVQLVSVPVVLEEGQRFFNHGSYSEEIIKTKLEFSVGPLDYRHKEILKYNKSITSNFKALINAGGICNGSGNGKVDVDRISSFGVNRSKTDGITITQHGELFTDSTACLYELVSTNQVFFKLVRENVASV